MHAQYRPAAWMMYLSAALQLIAPFVSGFNSGSLTLLVFAFVWGVIGYVLLTRGVRWLAWVGFLLALVGMIAGLTGMEGVPTWVTFGISLADLAAAACLFVVLWRSPKVRAA